ncbi:unnamed protein product [Symbiodinium sp. CCMP2456]|nr:unnamed protein product [Symbiodinium sp. CCMP2456]
MLPDAQCLLTILSLRSNLTAIETADLKPNLSALAFQDDSGSLCNHHWTWSGIAGFWHERENDQQHVSWSIDRSGAPSAVGQVTAELSPGAPCRSGSSLKSDSALVVVQSKDRFATNVWHRMAVIFMAWVTPRVLQLKGKLPQNITVAYYVPPLKESSMENDSGPYPWKMLGSLAPEDCGFEHRIRAPEDGFLWDLAWDLPMKCVHSSNLWRDFQSALYAGVGLVSNQSSDGRSVCYVGRPTASSDRQLSEKTFDALKQTTGRVRLDGEPLIFRPLAFDGSVPISKQAEMVSACDVLIGMHGAGLMHSIWMYPGSVVVELMDPEHAGAAYYRNVAHLSGHVYLQHAKSEVEEKPEVLKSLMVTAAEIISNKATNSLHVSMLQKAERRRVTYQQEPETGPRLVPALKGTHLFGEKKRCCGLVSKKNMDVQLADLQAAVNKAASEAARFLDVARTELGALAADIADFTAKHNHLRKADIDYQADLFDQQRRNDALSDQLEKLTARRRLAETRLQADMESLRTENTVLKRSMGALSNLSKDNKKRLTEISNWMSVLCGRHLERNHDTMLMAYQKRVVRRQAFYERISWVQLQHLRVVVEKLSKLLVERQEELKIARTRQEVRLYRRLTVEACCLLYEVRLRSGELQKDGSLTQNEAIEECLKKGKMKHRPTGLMMFFAKVTDITNRFKQKMLEKRMTLKAGFQP